MVALADCSRLLEGVAWWGRHVSIRIVLAHVLDVAPLRLVRSLSSLYSRTRISVAHD